MTPAALAAMLGRFAAVYGKEVTPALTSAWADALYEVRDRDGTPAGNQYIIAEHFFPTPSDIVRYVKQVQLFRSMDEANERAEARLGDSGQQSLPVGALASDQGQPALPTGTGQAHEVDRIASQAPQDGPERFVGRPLPPKPDLEAQRAINAAGMAHVRKCLAEVPAHKRRGTMFADEVLSQEFFSDVAVSEDEPFEVESYL